MVLLIYAIIPSVKFIHRGKFYFKGPSERIRREGWGAESMILMQSEGQTSTQRLHSVQDQESMEYVFKSLKIEFSGQISLQLSQRMHCLLISR